MTSNSKINFENDLVREILQKEWGYALSTDSKPILATTKIVYCTGFYGCDENNEIGFLCHFDLPGSTQALPELFRIIQHHIPKERKLNCVLMGGWSCLWSRWTRSRVLEFISILNASSWNIELLCEPFNSKLLTWNNGWGKAIQYDVRSGIATEYFNKPKIRTRGRTFYNTWLRQPARFVKDNDSNI